METTYVRHFGKQLEKDSLVIMATTWDGQRPIKVVTPKIPSYDERQETECFLLGDLDDHDAYSSYLKKLRTPSGNSYGFNCEMKARQ